MDTAPYGDEGAWSFPPDCGQGVEGWLRGRGAADSKPAAAMFWRIAAEVHGRSGELRGGLAVLLDVDEGLSDTRAASVAPAPTSPTRRRSARPG